MTSKKIQEKLIYAIQDDSQSGFILVIAENDKSKKGLIIVQTVAKQQYVIFQITGETIINQKKILQKMRAKCYLELKQVKIPMKEYYNIIQEINKGSLVKEQAQNNGNRHLNGEDDSEDQNHSSYQSVSGQIKKKRQISEYHDYSDMQNGDEKKRGRGRPKGSRNKKNILKEAGKDQLQDLRFALNTKMKRGKGRPKGSRNKPKQRIDSSNLIKNQNMSDVPFGKRGKGRPKGSKNKIKMPNAQLSDSQQGLQHEKKGRGRPRGVRNRPHSAMSIQQQEGMKSQSVQKVQVQRVDPDQVKQITCCRKCQQTKLKVDVQEDRIHLVDAFSSLTNICQDFGLQNKTNLVLGAIKNAQADYVRKLLSIVNKNQPSFKPPWDVQRMIQKTRYQVKTKKQFLTRSGKQGITALLHDCYKKKDVWWKDLTIDRIIQSLPRQVFVKQTLETLLSINPQLRQQFYLNFPTIVRSGNQYLAELILKDILIYQNLQKQSFHLNTNINMNMNFNMNINVNCPLNYSQEFMDMLIGNRQMLNQFQKANLIKHNDGQNYCSPIHCAAITSSKDFLSQLLLIFSDVINVQDSMLRKPIHYASSSANHLNLQALINAGAQLKQFDRKKITPLMIAAMQGNAHNVYYILQKVRQQAYINAKSDEGFTALHYAILKNHQDCVDTLLEDPYVLPKTQTKDGQDVFHLVAGTGNLQIFQKLIKRGISPTGQDKFKRTPLMLAIRNRHTEMFYRLIQEGAKTSRYDSSNNTLLHYAAAYGNPEIILYIKDKLHQPQIKNKRGFYPWQMAIMKGHKDCAQMLRQDQQEQQNFKFQFENDPLFLILTNLRGTQQYFDCIKYIYENSKCDINFQDKITNNGYLHLVCSYGEEQYQKIRKNQSSMTSQEIKQQFQFIQQSLIDFFLNQGLDGHLQNKKKQTPLKMCVENYNLIGVRKLLKKKLNFDLQSSYGTNIMHCLSSLACMGFQQMQFVHKKLMDADVQQLKANVKKIDQNGFDFLLFFVKTFTETTKNVFKKSLKKKLTSNQSIKQSEAQKLAFDQFVKYQSKFMDLIKFLISMGCDINSLVIDKKTEISQNFKKWGIQHFLMNFPSLKLAQFFKANKIRDFNLQNSKGRTPLHLFCINNIQENLLPTSYIDLPKDYKTEQILQYFLQNGMTPSSQDNNRSLPILYAALNHKYSFISILKKFKSPINVCNNQNQVPFIQVIKNIKYFTFEEIQSLLKNGADPNFQDLDKRNSLHHLVYSSTNFDSSPQLCKLLFDYGVKVNAVDKYKRSPIFYCFTKIVPQKNEKNDQLIQTQQTNDKVQILQMLLNHKDINLNLQDVFQRTLVHYACQRNYFFSILYILDKNINIESVDHEKNTPLGVCLKHRNLDQAALIIKKGVKYGFVYQNGQMLSYFAYAIKHLSVGICFMLLDYGYPIQKALQQVNTVTNNNDISFKQILIQKYINK